MIPAELEILTEEIELDFDMPSKDYKMNLDSETINGYVDELEAMKQVIYKILNTERYEHQIYSWDYGIELLDLFGMPISYVTSELKRRITEALTQDDRVTSVDSFSFETTRNTIHVTFTVHTEFGDIKAEKEVEK